MKKNIGLILILLVIIIIFGFILRVYSLNLQSFWMDESYSINAALSAIERGYPILDSGKPYKDQLFYTYILAGSIKLFGLHNWSARLPSVIFNLLFLLVIFLFTKNFFDKKTAFLTTAFLSFSYWEIAWARQARNYSLFQLFFWLSLYFFWQTLYRYRNKYLILCLICSAITLFTHSMGLLLLPVYLISALIIYWSKIGQNFGKYFFKKETLFLFTFILVLIIIFYNPIWALIKEEFFTPIFYLPNYLNFIHVNFLIILILSIASIFLYSGNKETGVKINLLLLTYILTLLIISTFVWLLNYRYLFIVLPIFYILSSLSIVYFLNKAKFYLKPLICFAVIIFIILSPEFQIKPRTIYALESDSPQQQLSYYAYTPQPDWQKAYQYIKDPREKDDIVISAQPVFNKIFLNEPGYWIYYSYSRKPEPHPLITERDTEYYVDAKVINDLEELQQIMKRNSGFIILDYMSVDDRINKEILNYIYQNTNLVFFDEINTWSKIWIYKF